MGSDTFAILSTALRRSVAISFPRIPLAFSSFHTRSRLAPPSSFGVFHMFRALFALSGRFSPFLQLFIFPNDLFFFAEERFFIAR